VIRISAPAKVNLFLAVRGRREDGFHELESVFQAIELADEVEFQPRPEGIRISADWPGLPDGEDNLCWRAANLLMEETGARRGVEIRLHKRIPPGAGLGGGSSDAAAVLLALNRLWELNLSAEALGRLAASLGADVAFFLKGGTALGRGRGEVLSSLPTPDLWFVLAWPEENLSTAQVYRAWDEQPAAGEASLEEMLEAVKSNDSRRTAACLRNDLEEAAMRLCPPIEGLKKELLEAGCLGAQVSGSGSAVFGIAQDENHAGEIAAVLSRQEGLWMRRSHALPAAASRPEVD
jgi:4-diphosphocytidyl-2-C-methyl-D-erythritol kinase